MNKKFNIGIIIVALIIVFCMIFGGLYNGIISKSEEVESKYSDIAVQLERRADLIPNLVNTVKGYAKHETEVIEKITTARENLINAKDLKEKSNANEELTNALNNLFIIVENYPELKSNINYINLQDESAGTENRISVARNYYNEAVKDYNKTIKSFPKNIIANILGFDEKEYFEAKITSSEVPNVSFE